MLKESPFLFLSRQLFSRGENSFSGTGQRGGLLTLDNLPHTLVLFFTLTHQSFGAWKPQTGTTSQSALSCPAPGIFSESRCCWPRQQSPHSLCQGNTVCQSKRACSRLFARSCRVNTKDVLNHGAEAYQKQVSQLYKNCRVHEDEQSPGAPFASAPPLCSRHRPPCDGKEQPWSSPRGNSPAREPTGMVNWRLAPCSNARLVVLVLQRACVRSHPRGNWPVGIRGLSASCL